MKLFKTTNYLCIFFSVGTLLFIIVTLASGARKMTFQISSVVPAAEGRVKVKKDKNKNYNIDLSTIRLAEPSRLDPPKSIYIVWMDTEQHGTKKVGQQKTSQQLTFQNHEEFIENRSAYNPTSFFISAEDNANVSSPSGQIVLRTE